MLKNDEPLKVVFAGGGTGGHIYPGLAVADSFKELCFKNGLDVKIFWIGNSSGMDRNIVGKNADKNGRKSADVFYGIPSGKLRRYFSFKNFLDIFKIASGFFASFFILLKTKPVLLFSKGGFVSVPPCLAAKILKIPVFTHECDFTPGLATRINARSAKKILLSYEETKNFFSGKAKEKSLVTGNPVRPVFYSADEKKGLSFLGIAEKRKPVLLVLGGSLGARQINELVLENIGWLLERFIVVHQTGEKNLSGLENVLQEHLKNPDLRNDYKAYPFIYSEMPDVISAADIVLSRAGANSIWECSALSKPLVLVPLCGSGTRGDQEDNAEFFRKKGAALVLSGGKADSENLKNALSFLLDGAERKKIASASGSLSEGKKPAERIAEILYNEIKANG